MKCKHCGNEHAPDPHYCIARMGEQIEALEENLAAALDSINHYNEQNAEQIAALTDENKRLWEVLDLIYVYFTDHPELTVQANVIQRVIEIVQTAIKETAENILHPEPLGAEFREVLREVPYEEEAKDGQAS